MIDNTNRVKRYNLKEYPDIYDKLVNKDNDVSNLSISTPFNIYCNKGHILRTDLYRIFNKSECGICSNKLTVAGVNDLLTLYPQLKTVIPIEFHNLITNSKKTSNEQIKIYGECGHLIAIKISKLSFIANKKHVPCPYCKGILFLEGFNDMPTIFPNWEKHWSANNKISPYKAMRKNSCLWICDNDHEYETTLNNKIHGVKCPYCSSQKILKGFNDLLTIMPEAINFWDFDLNKKINIYSLGSGVKRKVFWKCLDGHPSYLTEVYNFKAGKRCPVCSGKKLITGINDLETMRPNIAKIWDSEKNKKSANKIYYNSREYFHWKCDNGHEFKMSAVAMSARKNPCLECINFLYSHKEKELFNAIKSEFSNYNIVENSRVELEGKELDIWIPELKVGIEFNGEYYHSEKIWKTIKENHDYKETKAIEKNILLIIVWEKEWDLNPENVIKDIKNMIKNRIILEKYTYSFRRENAIDLKKDRRK